MVLQRGEEIDPYFSFLSGFPLNFLIKCKARKISVKSATFIALNFRVRQFIALKERILKEFSMSHQNHSVVECPHCGKYTIVQESATQWTCLNCSFSKDLSKQGLGGLVTVVGLIFLTILLFFI